MGSDLPYSCECGSIRIVSTEKGKVVSYRCDNGIYHSVTLNHVNTGHYAIQIQGNSVIAPLVEISILNQMGSVSVQNSVLVVEVLKITSNLVEFMVLDSSHNGMDASISIVLTWQSDVD